MASRRTTDSEQRELSSAAHGQWRHIDALLLEGGQVSIGRVHPIPCAAIASDEHNMLAVLQRRAREPLTDPLDRLDAAIAKALEHDEFTDEINALPPSRR